jgi:hypothetical protein
MPLGNFKKVLNQSSFALPNIDIATQLSAPQIEPQIAIDFKIIFGPLLLKGFILDNVCVKL